jgi:DNA-binding NarL/FixJ family response regulator
MADDHSIVLAGLRKLVEEHGELVGMVEDGRSLIEAAKKLRPDIILLDIAMPLLNGLDAARQLTKLVPRSKLIFMTMQSSPTYATEAFKAGASGYLLKRSAVTELSQAIQTVLKGQHYLTPLMTKEVLQSALNLQLLAEGKGTKDIASLLNLSVRTVEFHKSRIMETLDIHSTAELTKYAIAEGLITL